VGDQERVVERNAMVKRPVAVVSLRNEAEVVANEMTTEELEVSDRDTDRRELTLLTLVERKGVRHSTLADHGAKPQK
jgi:hypothetical protein